jgi:predicted lipoprotein with Yx(FWY)xxD motif
LAAVLLAADAAPGETKGQGINDVWFVIGADSADRPTGRGHGRARRERARLDPGRREGRTLYLFTNDADGVPTCYDDCATNWPPLLATGEVAVGTGLDAALC